MKAYPPIDAAKFDAIIRGPEKLWGLTAIADAIGLSVDATRRLAIAGRAPIYQPGGSGRYFAMRSELNAWLRMRPSAA